MTVNMNALWDEATTLEDVVDTYQDLINSGQAWKMDGHTGRTAMGLIKDGICVLGEEAHIDYWGNRVPSRYDVKPGTMGSLEYQQARKGKVN